MTEEVDTISGGASLGKIDLSGLDFGPSRIQPIPRMEWNPGYRIGELEAALRAIHVLTSSDDGSYSASGTVRNIKRIIESVPGLVSKT